MPTLLPPLAPLPQALIERLLHSAPVGAMDLTSSEREQICCWLSQVLIHRPSLREHMRFLWRQVGDPATDKEMSAATLEQLGEQLRLTFGDADSDQWESFDRLLEDGPAAVDQLAEPARLLLDVSLLYAVAQAIDQEMPPAWQDKINLDVRRLGFDETARQKKSPPIPLQQTVRPQPARWRWLLPAALAASVLLNLGGLAYLGLPSHRSKKGDNGIDWRRVASIKPDQRPRAAKESKSLFIESAEPGYAAIILLRPNKLPEILPPIGTTPIAVGESKQTSVEWPLEEQDLVAGGAVLLVVTRQPAAGFLQEQLSLGKYQPNRQDAIRAEVETLLTKHGYLAPAVRIVPMPN